MANLTLLPSAFSGPVPTPAPPPSAASPTNLSIPWDQIGAKAGADYHGDGLAVTPADFGARLHCVFQRLDGEATREGLWLTSSSTNALNDRFRIVASSVGRATSSSPVVSQALPDSGNVSISGQTVRFVRPGLVEEYSVSMDGVRQDFVVMDKPAGEGELQVRLAVAGAQLEQSADGAQLILNKSGRKIAYNRLRATDANGRELPVRIEVVSTGGDVAAVLVNDAAAAYPVRIDPTFSDANWISLGSSTLNHPVWALAASGNDVYLGGQFTTTGAIAADYVVQWNGSNWSPLGSGTSGPVLALAVAGTNLYAGGAFTTAGGVVVNDVAEWSGSNWMALGTGMNSVVWALAVSGSNLYAGGYFTNAGGITANYIAEWNGSNWNALGSGMNYWVLALAVSGTNLYAGGSFTNAGGVTANNIAEWNGSNWSALGSGTVGFNTVVRALAVSGTNLYMGGSFTNAGGVTANCIAEWNGSNWGALGQGTTGGLGPHVYALAVSGNNVYAGGVFATAGSSAANNIAEWNGSSWSALGSGVVQIDKQVAPSVYALTVSGSDLYVGGDFVLAGSNLSFYAAEASSVTPYNQLTAQPLGGGNVLLSYDGDAGTDYALDRTSDLSPPILWIPQATNQAVIGGEALFTNTPDPTTNNFWRVRSLP